MLRKDRSSSFLHAVIATAVLGVSAHASSPGKVQPYQCPTNPCNRFQIVWTGDTSLNANRHPYPHVKKIGLSNLFSKMKQVLKADYLVGNAEAPIVTEDQGQPIKKESKDPEAAKTPHWVSRMDPDAAKIFKEVGFNAMGTANNHAWDYGPGGLHYSRHYLEEAGIKTFGTGPNLTAAQEPLLIDTPHGKVGVVALVKIGSIAKAWVHEANETGPGMVFVTCGAIKRGAKLARQRGAKWVVGFAHWGNNYMEVNDKQRKWTNCFVKHKYDLVVGSHPHVVQKVQKVGKTLILYSLGNFVFTTSGRWSQFTGKQGMVDLSNGMVARTYLGPDGFEGVELTCLQVDNRRKDVDFTPRLCNEHEHTKLFTTMGGLSVPYHAPTMNLLSTPGISSEPLTKVAQERRRRRTGK